MAVVSRSHFGQIEGVDSLKNTPANLVETSRKTVSMMEDIFSLRFFLFFHKEEKVHAKKSTTAMHINFNKERKR